MGSDRGDAAAADGPTTPVASANNTPRQGRANSTSKMQESLESLRKKHEAIEAQLAAQQRQTLAIQKQLAMSEQRNKELAAQVTRLGWQDAAVLATKNSIAALRMAASGLAKAQPTCARPSPAQWDGAGSPFLLHLSNASFVALPHLVAELQAALDPCPPVLVGASAWNLYLNTPIDTEDLDFVVADVSRDKLLACLQQAIDNTCAVPAVATALGILDAISPLSGEVKQAIEDGLEDSRVKVLQKIRAAEEHAKRSPPSPSKVGGNLRLTTSDHGARIQVCFLRKEGKEGGGGDCCLRACLR